MEFSELAEYIAETYGAEPEAPWIQYPLYRVFRHPGNKKWFAVFMNLAGKTLGVTEQERMDVLNVKCDPILMGSLLKQPGFFPGYHMNKNHWLTVDMNTERETIKMLVHMSFEMTKPAEKGTRRKNNAPSGKMEGNG